MPIALAQTGRFEVRCNAAVSNVLPPAPESGSGWQVFLQGEQEPLPADSVILAGEPFAMAPLIRGASPDLADLLDPIFCPPVAVVAVGYKAHDARTVPAGFGVLIPRAEQFRILGCLFDSYLFPGRNPDGTLLVHAMLGGAVDADVGELTEAELLAAVRGDLSRLLRIDAKPVFQHVKLWKRAIPQYELHHLERVRRIEKETARLKGLHLAGNALHGIAFGKAAAAGKAAGDAAIQALLRRAFSEP